MAAKGTLWRRKMEPSIFFAKLVITDQWRSQDFGSGAGDDFSRFNFNAFGNIIETVIFFVNSGRVIAKFGLFLT
ncbi:MAG: hypothetical protein GY820_06450 [Gammaproteobacteria bacterium]|nr:hypothetical protein [Gammaproteobacteria bacterium]